MTPEAYQCVRCAEGYYNFKAGSTCQACPTTGAICRGGFNGSSGVSAKRGYYGYIQADTLRRDSESSDHKLSMFLCPEAEQCCRYDQCIVNGVTVCPPTRDPRTPLCGSCSGTLSETLGSVKCKQCSGTNWWLTAAFILLFCAIGYYLYYTVKSSNSSVVAVSQTIVTKCMAYCYQTIPLLVNSGSVAIVLQPLLSVFALKTSNGSGDGMCFIEGMNAMGKLLIPLMGPLFLMSVACVLLLVSTLRARLASTQDAAIEGRFSALHCLDSLQTQTSCV